MRRIMLQKIGGGFDPDYQAVLDYATTNAITKPSSFIQIGQNSLMIELKGYGLFSKLDVFFNTVDNTTINDGFKNICWKRLVEATSPGTPTYNLNGFNSITADSYFNTQFLWDGGSNYTLNDAFYGYVVHSINTDFISSNLNSTYNSFRVSDRQKRINATTNYTGSTNINFTGLDGFIGMNRLNSTTIELIHKSNLYSRTQSSTSLVNNFFCVNHYNAGTYDNTISSILLGASLTSTDIANFRSAFNNYLTYLGLSAFA